jgi:hypothetical protein
MFDRVIRYDNGGTPGSYVWGHTAQKYVNRGEKIHKWLRLGLCNNLKELYTQETEIVRGYEDQTALPMVEGEECIDLVIDFLRSIKRAVDKYLSSLDEEINRCPRSYIITVPALWDRYEREKTRRCAERADMGEGTHLQIITEPEAACIYSIQQMYSIKTHDMVVICDAGGVYVLPLSYALPRLCQRVSLRKGCCSIVDVASYKVEYLHLNPFDCRLTAPTASTGGLYGSTFLTPIFEAYLQEKLRDYEFWQADYMIEASKRFEESIKYQFTGESMDDHIIRIQGLIASQRHGIVQNFLILTTQELRVEVFDKIIDKIRDLVRDQIDHLKKLVKTVLLVGGFGRNPYLRRKLEDIDLVAKDNIRVQLIGDRQVQ